MCIRDRVIAADGEVFHLSVADLDADWVAAFIEFGDHAQARCGGGGADEAQDRLVAGQGSALPVPGDLGEQAVLDLVPFAGARREMADADVQAGLCRQSGELSLPGPATVAVGATGVGGDEQPRSVGGMRPRRLCSTMN